ncbi:MAG: response regulator transcription factor [Ruminococcus sp.]|nr:response regulator transcription factor [Ruminococcus sp.]
MPKILLVEDDIQLAKNLSLFLNSEGFTVVHATGQASGIDAFEGGSFDCVLLDLSLGDGSGFSVCAAIKAASDVPVIFLTASADEACTVAGFEVGADDYISKPFRPRELVARMKNAMRKNSRASAALSCGNVTIDPARGTVFKNGSEVYLSALEYRLLLVFFSNKGNLLTRDRLAEELWSVSGEYVSDNTLNVYMKRLREKIEDDPQSPSIIVTVRGMGYKAVDK